MRRVLKVLAVLVALLVLSVVLIPLLFKDRLVALITGELSERLDATVVLGDVDLSMLSSFPNLELSLRDLSITNRAPFEGVQLARIGSADLVLDIGTVLGGETVEVRHLALSDADLHIIVDENGRANYEMATDEPAPVDENSAAPPPVAEEPSSFSLAMRDYALQNVNLRYEDRAGHLDLDIQDLDHSGQAELSESNVHIVTRTDIASITLNDLGVELLSKLKLGADLAVDYDMDSGRITFGDNRLDLAALALKFQGSIEPKGEDTALDLKFEALETSFKSVLSLIPGAYKGDIAGLETSGQFALVGSVAGLLRAQGDDLPAFDLALSIKDGHFRYPDLPSSVDAINLDLKLHHPDGVFDLAEIDLPRFHLEVANLPLDGSLRLRNPDSDPDVDLKLKGSMDLARLSSALPLDGVSYTGTLDADMAVKGRVSAFDAQNLDAISASGFFRLSDFLYTDATLPEPVTIERLDLTVAPAQLDMADLRVRFGKSDLRATGRVDNALAYILQDAPLKGTMTLSSTLLDLRPWSGDDSAEAGAKGGPKGGAPEPTAGVATVPTNLDLKLDANLAQVLYDTYDMRNVAGTLIVRDGTVRMDPLNMEMLGGKIGLKGTYSAPTDQAADVELNVELQSLGLSETVQTFSTLGEIAPVAIKAPGSFSSGFNVKTTLKPDYSPDLVTLFSQGRLSATGVKLSPNFMNKVADILKNDKFSGLDLDGSELAFLVQNGRLKLDKLPLKIGGVSGSLVGSTGVLDQTLDLTLGLKVPTDAIKAADTLSRLGISGGGGAVDLLIKVGGTFDDPKVSVDLGSLTDALVDDLRGQAEAVVAEVKEQVVAKVTEVANNLLDEAKKKGDALIATANDAAQRVRDEAKKGGDKLIAAADKQADRLVADAKGNALKEAAAKEAGKAMRKEAKEKANKLNKEADAKATSLVDQATREKDRLISDASAKINGG